MSQLPRWARKPQLNGATVIATESGWERVNEKGNNELLVSHRGLLSKLKELGVELEEKAEATVDASKEIDALLGDVTEEKDEAPKKGGRPKKTSTAPKKKRTTRKKKAAPKKVEDDKAE